MSRFGYFVIMVVVAGLAVPDATSQGGTFLLSREEIIAGMKARDDALTSYSCSLSVLSTVNQPDEKGSAPKSRSKVVVRRDQASKRFEIITNEWDNAEGQGNKGQRFVHQLTKDGRTFSFSRSGMKPFPDGSGTVHRVSDIDNVLMNNAGQAGVILRGSIFDPLPLWSLLEKQDRLDVKSTDKTVDGVNCVFVESSGKYGTYRVWLDPNTGFAPVRIEIVKGTEDLGWSDKSLKEQGISSVSLTLSDVVVKQVGGVYFPFSGTLFQEQTAINGSKVSLSDQITVEDLDLSPNFSGTEAFNLDVPNSTLFFDMDAPGIRYQFQNGELHPFVDKVEADATASNPQQQLSDAIPKEGKDSLLKAKEGVEKNIANQAGSPVMQSKPMLFIVVLCALALLLGTGLVVFKKNAYNRKRHDNDL